MVLCFSSCSVGLHQSVCQQDILYYMKILCKCTQTEMHTQWNTFIQRWIKTQTENTDPWRVNTYANWGLQIYVFEIIKLFRVSKIIISLCWNYTVYMDLFFLSQIQRVRYKVQNGLISISKPNIKQSCQTENHSIALGKHTQQQFKQRK